MIPGGLCSSYAKCHFNAMQNVPTLVIVGNKTDLEEAREREKVHEHIVKEWSSAENNFYVSVR